eukprot:scaffold16140_cov28-Tisochrysis_lutea.AAC.2
MGWGAGGLYVQHFTLNVGCAFFRPTPRAVALMERVANRLSQAAAWDQEVRRELHVQCHEATSQAAPKQARLLHRTCRVFFQHTACGKTPCAACGKT